MNSHLLYEQRDRDLMRLCRSLMISSCADEIQSLRELAEAALACGAPRYYVDIYFAYRKIQLMRKGIAVPRRPAAKRMWEEIMHKVSAVQAARPRLSLIKAVTEVLVREHASGFFLEPDTMVRILQKYNRENKSQRFYFKS